AWPAAPAPASAAPSQARSACGGRSPTNRVRAGSWGVRCLWGGLAAVVAELEITDPSLVLPQPLIAQVEEASLLGGDAVVALIAPSRPLPSGTPGPRDRNCNSALTVCPGMTLNGTNAASLSSVTALMQKLLDQAQQENIVPKLGKATGSFEQASREAAKFLVDGQQLIGDLRVSVAKVQPTITNLNASTANIRNITRALDNPKTISELKQTVANAEKLTARWDQVGGDVEKLTADPQFMDGLRSVSIGLGKFFNELYPAQTAPPKAIPLKTAPKPR
ncbi:MAG: hypothetical protein RLZZ515_1470, partial [Cyanobacteriota bacterium]